MHHDVEAYLDIETTGLSRSDSEITVIGIYICDGDDTRFTQLVGKDITAQNLIDALDGVCNIYTYNGGRFDLPFIYSSLGVQLAEMFTHRDLMFDCWENNLYGGLKAVENQLGIERRLKDVNGFEAIRLWWRYIDCFDKKALKILLEYNKEDVVNLKTLKGKLLSC
ncbi:ribonuclease H-like domain-containing protein [Chloroflexota bacterium]